MESHRGDVATVKSDAFGLVTMLLSGVLVEVELLQGQLTDISIGGLESD